jgi:XTP/dITP diphosphohydrolase
MTMGKKIFFGTGNAKKLKEIKEILGERFTLLSFTDLPSPIEVEETEPNLEGNAILKAKAYHLATGLPCFADDTGLEVNALGGAPGVFSARYAGANGDAKANMEKLLAALEGHDDRSARFRTVIAWYDGEALELFEGVLNGHIIHEPVGENGFGYDPIFVPEGYDLSLAQMTAESKNSISHRGKALRKFTDFLA